MSDQKRWFKVWATINTDPAHMNMSLEDVGRWTRLGALIVAVGNRGKLTIIPPAKYILTAMECDTLVHLKEAFKRLPHVTFEECENDNGNFIVTIKNWYKYQVDSTVYERVKRLRSKRRGEEIRGDKSPPSPKSFSVSPISKSKANGPKTEATEEELKQVHLKTVQFLGRCPHDRCRFCSPKGRQSKKSGVPIVVTGKIGV